MGFVFLVFILSFVLVKTTPGASTVSKYIERVIYSIMISAIGALISVAIGSSWCPNENVYTKSEEIIQIDNKPYVLNSDGYYLLCTINQDTTYNMYNINPNKIIDFHKNGYTNSFESNSDNQKELLIYDIKLTPPYKYIFFTYGSRYSIL